MQVPSAGHERRREVLETVALLGGCPAHAHLSSLPDATRPDVLRYAVSARLVFLGEAKHTETPGCAATQRRLRSYFGWLVSALASGLTARVAICHPPGDEGPWYRLLVALAADHAAQVSDGGSVTVDRDDVITWIDL